MTERPVTDGLVRFLLERISDDERDIARQRKAAVPGGVFTVARALAECGAKRDIIGVMQRMIVLRDLPIEQPVRNAGNDVLKRLAVLYTEHAGYRPEWRPRTGGSTSGGPNRE